MNRRNLNQTEIDALPLELRVAYKIKPWNQGAAERIRDLGTWARTMGASVFQDEGISPTEAAIAAEDYAKSWLTFIKREITHAPFSQ